MDHVELPMYAYGFKCSCGVVSMGTKEDPAYFSDHLMAVSASEVLETVTSDKIAARRIN